MVTIAVGGIQHETNTASPTLTPLSAFIVGGGWPGWKKGDEIHETLAGMNLPISGALAALCADPRVGKAQIRPLIWAAATPSGKVTNHAFDALAHELIERLESVGRVDGLYLDLHGAMVTESFDDGEGELLVRLRRRFGDSLPIVVSLDLHANVSRVLFDLCDAIVVYRTYPHIDMKETGERAAAMLIERIVRARSWAKAFATVEFVAPLTAQCTLAEPASSLMTQLVRCERGAGLTSMSWACGFPLAKISDARQTVFAYGDDRDEVQRAVALLCKSIEAERERFVEVPYSPNAAVREAMRLAEEVELPVILCDTNDNPGAGGSSDTTGILRALISNGARQAVVAIVCDAVVASEAHVAGEGALISAALGGRTCIAGNVPFSSEFTVERLGSGRFKGTGPMWRDSDIDLGPMALLRVENSDVRVIVSSRTMQAADRSIFHHLGIDPKSSKILALKSSVHFRADFGTISSEVLIVSAPGGCAGGR